MVVTRAVNYPWLATFEKRTDAQQQDIERLAALTSQWTEKIRRAFVAAVGKLSDDFDVEAIADLLRQGRSADALLAVNTALQKGGFEPVAIAASDAAIAAGRSAAAVMGEIPQLAGINFSFGVTNPATVVALQQYEFKLVRELTATARASVAHVVQVGVTAGRNPLDTARNVRSAIGLTAQQVQAVSNFRRALENSPNDALDRALRDARYDPTIARAVRQRSTIAPEKIDAMVQRYHDRHLKYRSQTIARTESIRAVNKGNIDAWRQAISSGKVSADAVTKRWIFTHDAKTRHAHRSIPAMNKVDPGIDGKFRSELGPISFPGDPEASGSNTISCRCSVILRFRPTL